MNELVSVMIPAYNAEKYIGRCIESLLNQTYSNIELVVVNDGSKDSTRSICESFASKDSRVRLINQENGGEGAARNRGLEEARGKYLSFVDADDYVKADFIESMVSMIESNNAQLAICGFSELKDDQIINETSGEQIILTQEDAMEQLLREDSFKGYVWNKMYDLDYIKEKGLKFDPSLAVWTDVLFVYQYLLHVTKAVFNPRPLYYYIYVDNSASHAANHVLGVKKSYSAIRAQEQMAVCIPEGYTRFEKQMAVRFVQNSLATIRNIGYAASMKEDISYMEQCQSYIKQYFNIAKDRLSKKDRILARLSVSCPALLMLLYKINNK